MKDEEWENSQEGKDWERNRKYILGLFYDTPFSIRENPQQNGYGYNGWFEGLITRTDEELEIVYAVIVIYTYGELEIRFSKKKMIQIILSI